MVRQGYCKRPYPGGDKDQGFVTSDGRFVGRKEALRIADAAGQKVLKRYGGKLYSEFIWDKEGKPYD